MISEEGKRILALVKELVLKLEHLETQSQQPAVYLIPFGKHKGQKLDDLPAGYLDWLRDQDWVEEKHPEIWKYINDNSNLIDKELDDELDEDVSLHAHEFDLPF